MNTLFTALCLVCLSACAIVYKTDTIGQNIQKIESDFQSQINQSQKNMQSLERYWAVVKSSKSIALTKDYAEIKKEVEQLRTIVNNQLPQELDKFKKFSQEKWEFIKEKKQIQKSDPRYKSYLAVKKYTEDLSARLQAKNDLAQKHFHKIKRFFKALKLYEVNPKKLDIDVNKGLSSMKSQIDQIKVNLQHLSENVAKDSNKSRKFQRKKVITKLNHVLNQIKTAKLNFEPLLRKFRKETADKNHKIVVIPEMASHTILDEMNDLIKRIRELGKQFNSRVEELKALK